jgi:hypothetical protein
MSPSSAVQQHNLDALEAGNKIMLGMATTTVACLLIVKIRQVPAQKNGAVGKWSNI